MKRMMVLTAAVAAALTLPGMGAAQEPPTRDSVTTVGLTNAGPELGPPIPGTLWQGIEIDVSSGPSGENPVGGFGALNFEALRDVSGSATCLAVEGNTATFNGIGYFGLVTVQVVDGAPDTFDIAITGEVDFSTGEWFSGRRPEDCSPLETGPGPYPVVLGDIRVVDARPPLPTSATQCRHGGWRTWGFKNHGECVRFVRTGMPEPT
jgi:hypothetical protein